MKDLISYIIGMTDDAILERQFPKKIFGFNIVYEFLIKKDFKPVRYKSIDFNNFNQFKDILDKKNSKLFVYKDGLIKEIFIADTSKEPISETNPIYFIDFNNSYRYYKLVNKLNEFEINEKQFVDEVNRHFNWQ